MAETRLEILKRMADGNPGDCFPRYALALEYRRTGDTEAAVGEFRALIGASPGYVAAYFHLGQALEALGRDEEARSAYRTGIEAATQANDRHALGELEGALDLLG